VNGGFGFAEPLEHRLGALAPRRRQARPIDEREDRREAAVRSMDVLGGRLGSNVRVRCAGDVLVRGACRVRVLVDAEFRRSDAGAQDALDVHVRVAQREAAERVAQTFDRHAGVDERAEHHVAGDARETIEIENARH
jgi:hypothetical protein